MITGVTITGADDGVNVQELTDLFIDYSFVEWGILISEKRRGTPRYPSHEWLYQLLAYKRYYPEMPLSMHLCGSYVYSLISQSDNRVFHDYWWALKYFERIQINHGPIAHDRLIALTEILRVYQGKEFIFQYGDGKEELLQICDSYRVNASCLFDASGGKGIVPEEQPSPILNIKCGYAGGLSPDNLKRQIDLIENKAWTTPIWIDMESGVRTDDKFDLDKVRQCLKIVDQYMSGYYNLTTKRRSCL